MKNNKKKGFTLVELLVVIAILAILATVATVGYTAFIESATVSNDENVAAQLNQFLAAVKVDSNGPFYGKDINEDNIMELTQYILDDSGYGDLIPQAAKYGYHFYFDLDKEKYVVIGDKDERILSMSPLSMLFASAAGESTNGHPESCFTEGRRYFLVETGTELSELVAGFKNITTADGLKEYYAKVSNYKTDAKQSLTGLITLVEKTVFATAEGYLVVEDAGHTVLFVPANLDGVKLSGVKVNVLNNKATTPISSENPLITLGDGYVFNIPKPEMIFGNALWFDGEHYTPDENGEYTTTLKFNLSLEEIKAIVDQNFTNVVFELNDGKQYGYIDGAIVCLTDGTSTEVTSKVGVQSFKIGIEGKTEEGAYSVPFDVAKTETYKMYAYGFVSTDSFNPDNVPDETVTWEIVEDQYTPDNANINENGVITGISAGTIRVKATSTVTNTATAEFIINIGSIDGILGIAYANGNGSNSGTIEFDANTGEPDEIINHQINNESNNNFTFTVTPNYYFANITNCDDTFSVEIEGGVQPEFELDQANNTASVNFTKAGTYTITVAYVAYPEVSRTFTVKVTNVVTGFEVGYMDGENKVTDLIYKDFNEVNGTTFDMNVFATTSDGSDNMTGHTVTWSCVGPNGDVAIDTDGKFTVTAAGTYTISATVDGTTKEFNLYVDSPLRPEISFNGTKADIDDEKVDNKYAAEMPGDYYYQMGSVGDNKIPFTVAVKYTYGETFGNITPDITTSDNATYENSYLTITKAGDVVVTISVPGYPELTTVFTVEARNKVTGLDLTVNNTTNSVEKIDDKFYIIPGADNNFTVDASFTFQYEGEKINPDITWSVESGAEYVECTKNGVIIGTFHIKAKPSTGTVITIKATDSVNNLEKTIKIVINELTSFDLDCSDIKDGDKLKLHAIGNTIYVAYDLTTGSFTLTPTDFKGVDNAPVPPSSVTWSTSDTDGEYISIDNGTVTIKKALPDNITITASAGGINVPVELNIVRVKTATVGSYVVDGQAVTTLKHDWSYTGSNTTFTLPSAVTNVTYAVKGVTLTESPVDCDITLDYVTGNTVFTESNGTLTLVDDVFGTQTVTIKVGTELSEDLTITVTDDSATPFEVNNITDGVKMGEIYLLRVGNENSFTIDKLFNSSKPANSTTLKIYDASLTSGLGQLNEITKIADDEDPNGFCATYNTSISGETWTTETIKFYGTGVAIIELGSTKLAVEVVNGKNITTGEKLGSGNNVLLSDFSASSLTVDSGEFFWGNGFTFDIRSGANDTKGIINLYGTIDNARIIGQVYNIHEGSAYKPYNASAIVAYDGAIIANSYVSGCYSPVRVEGDVKIINSTLEGGRYANVNVRSGSLTLEDVTTINQAKDGLVGLGIVVYSSATSDTSIIINGTLKQYNFVKQADSSTLPDSSYTAAFNKIFTSSDFEDIRFTDENDVVYVNTGILFMNGSANLTNTPNNYTMATTSISTYTAHVFSWDNSKNEFDSNSLKYNEWKPTKQYTYEPSFKFTGLPDSDSNTQNYAWYDGTIHLGSATGTYIIEDIWSMITLDKYTGIGLGKSVSVTNGTVEGSKVTFTGDGTITFTIKDASVYDETGTLIPTPVVYTYTIMVDVETTTKPKVEIQHTGSKGVVWGSYSTGCEDDYHVCLAIMDGLKITAGDTVIYDAATMDKTKLPANLTVTGVCTATGGSATDLGDFTEFKTYNGALYLCSTGSINNPDTSTTIEVTFTFDGGDTYQSTSVTLTFKSTSTNSVKYSNFK